MSGNPYPDGYQGTYGMYQQPPPREQVVRLSDRDRKTLATIVWILLLMMLMLSATYVRLGNLRLDVKVVTPVPGQSAYDGATPDPSTARA